MAEGSRVSLRYLKETIWGEQAVGQYKEVNMEEESFALNKTKERKKTVLPTREYAGMRAKTQETEGGFKNPLQAVNIDELIEGALMSTWTDITGGAGGGTITAGLTSSNLDVEFIAETVVDDGGIIRFGSGITIDITKDQVIFVAGTPSGENDGSYIVKAISGQDVTVNDPLTDAVYESGCVVSGDMIRNGATLTSYTFERAHLDVGAYFQYIGEVLSSMEIGFESEEPVNISFDFKGKDETTDSSSVSTGDPVPAINNPDFINGDNVDGVYVDYALMPDCFIQSLSITVDNQVEARKGIAVFGPCSMRIKPIDVSGSISMMFTDLINYNRYINDTPIQLAIIIGDSLGNKYAFTVASAEFTTGNTNVSDAEDEVPEEHEFSGSTNGAFTIQICKSLV